MKDEKDIPILVDQKKHCCGCSACYAKCTVKAIKMRADEEGFLYPEINPDKCIRCYQCLKVCIFKENQNQRGYY